MRKPKLSVVMSVFNGGQFLNEALESVLAQTQGDFEFIIIDDASTDGSLDVLESYAKRDDRITLIPEAKNVGLVSALNIGLSAANSPLIARMDADDICRKDRFEKQIWEFERQDDLVLLGSAFDYVDTGGKRLLSGSPPCENEALQSYLIDSGNPFCHPSVMMRTDHVKALDGYRQTVNRYAQDYDLFLRLAERGRIGNLSDKLISYRVHPGQITIKKMKPQLFSAGVYRALATQRRNGFEENVALASVEAEKLFLKSSLIGGYLFWADMMELMNESAQARKLRMTALRTDPLHRDVWRMIKKKVKSKVQRS